MAKYTLTIEDIDDNVSYNWEIATDSETATPASVLTNEVNTFLTHFFIHKGATPPIEEFKNLVRDEVIREYIESEGAKPNKKAAGKK